MKRKKIINLALGIIPFACLFFVGNFCMFQDIGWKGVLQVWGLILFIVGGIVSGIYFLQKGICDE